MKRNARAILLALCLGSTASFADPVVINIDAAASGKQVAPTLHGLFFEDINYAADGGLYAELIQNRSFEHRDPMFSWQETARGGAKGTASVAKENPIHANNPSFIRLHVEAPGTEGFGLVNGGFDGIPLKQGERYSFSIYARNSSGDRATVAVRLETPDGRLLVEKRITRVERDWKRHTVTFKSPATLTNAALVVLSQQPGAVDLDMISLFPEKTFKGRPNGLRADIAQSLADMKPHFMRFPGGCIVEGKDIANMYRWKDTVGDVAMRKQNENLWQNGGSPQYHQTYGLGFFEYFQLCEDIGAEPVPVVNCGMACQARKGPLVPLGELDPFVQDALDLIEFANGPVSSQWGSLRASMGHPGPFNLKFLAVGNEQWQQEYFDRYIVFQKGIRAKYPEISIISSAGPFVEDPHWHFAWNQFKSGVPADVVDEHYYVPPQWLLEKVDRYSSYDRNGPKIFVGEYAAHDRSRKNNMRSALAEAAYVTGLWKNSDVVAMASYAPLFARIGHVQWQPNLIWFNGTEVLRTPNYHVQALSSQNQPSTVLPIQVNAPLKSPLASGMIGVGTWNTQSEYKDIKVVSATGDVLYESDFSKGLQGWKIAGGDWKIVDGALRQAGEGENVRAVLGDPSWSDYTLTLRARKLSGSEGFLIMFETLGIESPVWWNLGGWRNTEHGLQGEGLPEKRIKGQIETGRWYDIRIESRPAGVKAFLDGQLVQEGHRKPTTTLFAAAGRSEKGSKGEFIVSVVNVSPEPCDAEIRFSGASGLGKSAKAWTMSSASPDDENTFANPDKIAPRSKSLKVGGAGLRHVFEPNSVTVMRLPARQTADRYEN